MQSPIKYPTFVVICFSDRLTIAHSRISPLDVDATVVLTWVKSLLFRHQYDCQLLQLEVYLIGVNYCVDFSVHTTEKWVQNPFLNILFHTKVDQVASECIRLVQYNPLFSE